MKKIMIGDWPVFSLDMCESTNDEAEKLAIQGTPPGFAVWTRTQTNGRGRSGRSWSTPAGALAFTLVLDAPKAVELWPATTLVAALALAEMISKTYAINASIKWPNDILINGKKVAGILSQAIAEKKILLIGIGVNLNCREADLPRELLYPATTLLDAAQKQVLPEIFLNEFFVLFAKHKAEFYANGLKMLKKLISERLAFVGEKITVSESATSRISGTVKGINDQGHLLLNSDTGETHTIISGDLLRSLE